MTKLGLYGCTLLLLILLYLPGYSQYQLRVVCVDRDSVFNQKNLGLQTAFKNRDACAAYIYQIPAMLQARGFATASVDSVHYDSLHAIINLYIGDVYKWGHISTRREDETVLAASGWNDLKMTGKLLNFQQLQKGQQQVLDYLENNGYPFARISLDSIQIEQGRLSAVLSVFRGPLYKIDSIRIIGTAKISLDFLQRYLNIPNGSIYRKEKLQAISKKIMELPYIQEERPWSLTLLGSGTILNLYLKPKKSSQIDVLVGFLPNNDQLTNNRLLITGEATVNLKNALGNGESIGLNWQQVQVKSPRLNLYFQEPFIFNTPLGVNASFDLFKKDSSYININGILGVQYTASSTKNGSVFIQAAGSNLITVDTQQVISTRQLPSQGDVSSVSLGITYNFVNTNYRFNPLRGNEFSFVGAAGSRTVHKNNSIVKLIDPSDSAFDFNSLYDSVKLNSYEFRARLQAAHYFQVSKASTLKLGLNGGIFQSPNSFRNEVFQIGGYKLLRGFDEESILAAQFVVGTLEYHYLIGQNSFIFSFVDYGWAENKVPGYAMNSTYLGFGVGLAFETKAGIFNMSYALGKTGDNPLNIRQAKIHLGYLNFF